MELIEKRGNIEIWAVTEAWGVDFYVYGVTQSGDPVVCPSLGMAQSKAAR